MRLTDPVLADAFRFSSGAVPSSNPEVEPLPEAAQVEGQVTLFNHGISELDRSGENSQVHSRGRSSSHLPPAKRTHHGGGTPAFHALGTHSNQFTTGLVESGVSKGS